MNYPSLNNTALAWNEQEGGLTGTAKTFSFHLRSLLSPFLYMCTFWLISTPHPMSYKEHIQEFGVGMMAPSTQTCSDLLGLIFPSMNQQIMGANTNQCRSSFVLGSNPSFAIHATSTATYCSYCCHLLRNRSPPLQPTLGYHPETTPPG